MNVRGMRKKVTIQSPTLVNSSFGEPVETWTNFAANRWAEVIPRNGLEAFSAQRVRDENTITFRMRYVDGVTQKMKLVYNGKDYDILSAVPSDSLKRELFIECLIRG